MKLSSFPWPARKHLPRSNYWRMRLRTWQPSELERGLVAAALVGLALRLFFVWCFPFVAGDTKIYEELARNWLDHGAYGLFMDGRLTPVDIRAPGYPAFLAAVYVLFGRTRLAVMLVQAALDVGTCFLTAALAGRIAPAGAPLAALWLAALCPFVANYAAVPLTEVLAAFLTTLALFFLLTAYEQSGRRGWFLGGLAAGLGTLVRPETPLLLAAVAAALCARWWRPADWRKLVRAGLWMAAGLLLPLLPWAARNSHTLGRVQFLAPSHAELPGEYVPLGFFAWTKTWLVSYSEVPLVWKLEEDPIPLGSLPAAAFDSGQEYARVGALLERYNEETTMPPLLDSEFARLARERTARHPLRTYLWVPLARAVTVWFTPRIELLPYSGSLWPPGEKWEEDPVDFLVTIVFGLLNFAYAGLALLGVWRFRRHPAVWLLVGFLLLRTALLTQVDTPEPRYLVVGFPAILALASLVWAVPR